MRQLSLLGAVRTEAQLCIEAAATLCDVLVCDGCDLYPLASAFDAGAFETCAAPLAHSRCPSS